MSKQARVTAVKNLKMVLKNEAGDNEAQIISNIQNILVENAVLSERDRRSILEELSEDKAFEDAKKDFDIIKKAFTRYKGQSDDYKYISSMENLMEGILYGKSQEEGVGRALNTLYNDMFFRYRDNGYKMTETIKQDVKSKAAQQMAESINQQLQSQGLVMGVRIVYDGEKLKAEYSSTKKMTASRFYPDGTGYGFYLTDNIDSLMRSNRDNADIYNKLQKFKTNIDNAEKTFNDHKAVLQGQLDKLNKTLDESVDKAVKQAEKPETRKNIHKKETKMICGMVGSILLGVALFAAGVALIALAPPIGAGLMVGLGLAAANLGLLGGIGGAIGFGIGLDSVKNKAPREEAIDFFDKASSASKEIVGTFKEMREEIEGKKPASPAAEQETVGKHTGALAKEGATQVPDTKPIEEQFDKIITEMEGLKTEVANMKPTQQEKAPETTKETAATQAQSQDAKKMFDGVLNTLKTTAAVVTQNTAAASVLLNASREKSVGVS